jgi:hypothetical protein
MPEALADELRDFKVKFATVAPHPDPSSYAKKFSGKYAHRIINGGVGHNLPQEAPRAFADAVVEVDGD